MDGLREKEIEELLHKANLKPENLKHLAREVSKNTWSPISHFPVGAVIVAVNENRELKVFSGTNVEPTVNLCLCAERVALYNAISAGYRKFIALAISLPKTESQSSEKIDINLVTPCGACREVLLQTLDPKATIYIDQVDRTYNARELLPHPILDVNKLKTLSIEEMDTLENARHALHNAHVPYTKSKYGVAILVDACDEIFSAATLDSASIGCSSEPLNACFGSITARGLIKNKIKAIAFSFPFVKYPTGDLLQLMSDYCGPNTKIIIDNLGVANIDDLLPWAFKLHS